MAAVGAIGGLLSGAVSAFGAIAGAEHQQRQLEAQARMARMQADQADTAYRKDMMRQLSNIKAIRSSAGMDTDSPTFQAIMDDNRDTADENRHKRVAGYNLQASQYEADASVVGRLGFIQALGGLIGGLA